MDPYFLPTPTDAGMVLVLGETGAGKSFFVKKLTSNSKVKVGHGLESCTQESQPFEAQIGGTRIFLIDTPGFDDSIRSDGDIILEICKSLSTQATIGACGVNLLGLIYLHDITVPRMRGSLKRELEILKLILGPQNYRSLLLVTTKWGDDTRFQEFEKRQHELEDTYWEDLIDGGAGVYRFEGNPESAMSIVSQLNTGARVVLALQTQLTAAPGVRLRDTPVGKYVTQMRQQRKSELEAISKNPRTRQEEISALQNSLDVGGLDPQKLDVEIHEKIKAYIEECVDKKFKETKNKPSALNIITWTLSAIGTILGALGATGSL